MGGCDVISVQRVDPDRVTKYGYTALEISAINGRTEIVRLLVREHGANVNKMNDNICQLRWAFSIYLFCLCSLSADNN